MDARQSPRAIFGFEGFRPGQEAAIRAARARRDALVVMPTGSGKSPEVADDICRRLSLRDLARITLRYFGDPARAPDDDGCCDICAARAEAA